MIDEKEVITIEQVSDEQQSLALVAQTASQVQITTPEDLILLLKQVAFNDQLPFEEQAIRAVRLIPGLVDKIQTNTIGLGFLLWQLNDLWYEHYRGYLLGGGPRERDGFFQWGVDTLHLNVKYMEDAITLFEDWANARRFKIDASVMVAQPPSPLIRQIAKKKFSDAERKIGAIEDDTRLSKEQKRVRIEEVEETTREEVDFLFSQPEHVVVQKKKEEKGTPDQITVRYSDVRISSNQDEVVGILSFKPAGDKSAIDVIQLFHRVLNKELFYIPVTLHENHMVLRDLAALANHMDSAMMREEVEEGIYYDEGDGDEEEEDEDEEEDYEL